MQEREKGVQGERQHGLSILHQPICAPPSRCRGKSMLLLSVLRIYSQYTLISQDLSFTESPLER
jgi:hypothetical protein